MNAVSESARILSSGVPEECPGMRAGIETTKALRAVTTCTKELSSPGDRSQETEFRRKEEAGRRLLDRRALARVALDGTIGHGHGHGHGAGCGGAGSQTIRVARPRDERTSQ